jgi:cell division protein FtsQ
VSQSRRDPSGRAAVATLPRASPSLGRLLPSGRSLLVAFALVAAAVGAYALARETSMFAVRRIDVVGAPPRVAAHVRAALGSVAGTSLLALDGSSVDRRLAGLPDVASARYDRAFPHTLRVVVRPEVPVGILRLGSKAWLVSARARVVALAAPSRRSRLARIWAPAGTTVELGGTVVNPLIARAVRALSTLAATEPTLAVRDVRSTDRELTLLLRSGVAVELANAQALALKLAVAERILPHVRGSGSLDVSVPERPVFTANSQPAG